MLQDPVKGVLVPLVPEEAQALARADQIAFVPDDSYIDDAWKDLSDLKASASIGDVALGRFLHVLPTLPSPEVAAYSHAYSVMVAGQYAEAGAEFAAVALGRGPVAAALFGVALSLEKLGSYEEAESLAAFLADLPGFDDPRAAALAGYAAFQRRQPRAARVHLAKAARIARMKPEFRGVQRFAQRVLLMQQFALGD